MEKTKNILRSIIYYVYLIVLTVGVLIISYLMWCFADAIDSPLWKFLMGTLNGVALLYCLHGGIQFKNNNIQK